MSSGRFQFARGNLEKLLAIPKYVFSLLLSVFVPRTTLQWAFGSGIGVGEGALALALQLRTEQPDVNIVWLTTTDTEDSLAEAHGLTPIRKHTWKGYWATLRSGTLVVTHGLGDVNRFGVFGGTVIQLWHGMPLKRIHLDSSVTTAVQGPAPIRALLNAMYRRGTRQVALYVAGSIDAAERLRSAFRVDPGRVQVLGDPRDDALARQADDPALARAARAEVSALLGLTDDVAARAEEKYVLYAPTWRDGDTDPAIPDARERDLIDTALETMGARLIIRSHPLGAGSYDEVLGERVHALDASLARDITPLLGAFDAVITDYSSIAIDFALLERPIVWFAPDLADYTRTRGLYEPLEVTAGGIVDYTWEATLDRLTRVLIPGTGDQRESIRAARELRTRFHAHHDGASAARVLAAITELKRPARDLVPDGAVFFESFYGRQIACNPLAIDREIAKQFPHTPRIWSVTNERQTVPEGATAVLVGGRSWHAARRYAKMLIVNDWLRYGFTRRHGQLVVQTWHGTMLKHLALGRPNVSLRTKIAIRRESRRWNLLLSQNPHSTDQFETSYAYRGEILETGYPRVDRLARAALGTGRNPIAVRAARAQLGIPDGTSVLAYVPTWRDGSATVVDVLDVNALAAELGDDWVIVARGHTRTHAFGGYGRGDLRVIDASQHPDVNDVILAADLLVTDYSSVMFDAAAARVPLVFFVPDLQAYRDRERGFTFDFEHDAPGPLITERSKVVEYARAVRESGNDAEWIGEHAAAALLWRERFVPHDNGSASARVVARLEELGGLAAH